MPQVRQPARHGILTELAEAALRAFVACISPEQGFALMGGTALAEYYLGHRPSEDLDFFTLDGDALEPTGRRFPEAMRHERSDVSVRTDLRTPDLWRFVIEPAGGGSFGLEMFRDAPPRFGRVHTIEGVPVASLTDIAEGKMEAFVHRRDPKDVVDVWALSALGGVDPATVYPLVYRKNPGLAEHPLAIAEALREAQSPQPVMPPLTVELAPGELERFFREEYDRFMAMEAQPYR